MVKAGISVEPQIKQLYRVKNSQYYAMLVKNEPQSLKAVMVFWEATELRIIKKRVKMLNGF